MRLWRCKAGRHLGEERIQAMQGLTTSSLLFSSRSLETLVSTANVGGMYRIKLLPTQARPRARAFRGGCTRSLMLQAEMDHYRPLHTPKAMRHLDHVAPRARDGSDGPLFACKR